MSAEHKRKFHDSWNHFYEALSLFSWLQKQGYEGYCVTVALTALLGRRRLQGVSPYMLQHWQSRDYLYARLQQKGFAIQRPSSAEEYLHLLSARDTWGALCFVQCHAFSIIRLWESPMGVEFSLRRIDTAMDDVFSTMTMRQQPSLYESIMGNASPDGENILVFSRERE